MSAYFQTCLASTAYLDPCVLPDWARVVRPGGLVVFTHPTNITGRWEPRQEEMVVRGEWEEVWVGRVPYLPTSGDPGLENGKIYVYRIK